MTFLTFVGNEGKEFTHKNPPRRMFCDYLEGRPYPRDTRENDSLAQLFSFQSCASHMPFRGNPSRELVAKCTDLQINLSLHQLNTKPNAIKSHNTRNKIKAITTHFVME